MIHSTALVSPDADLASGVSVGPYAVIGPGVSIGAGTSVGAHCVLQGPTSIGRDNRIFPFCSLGAEPQDKKYSGEPTRLEIGERNTVREFCTFNRGTAQDAGVTRLGNDNWIMAYVHLAHDCQVGDNTVFANNASLAGHVHVGDYAILGGFTGVHQFVKVGAHCITGIASVVLQDLPPYVMAAGNPAQPHGVNQEGLKRRGFSPAAVSRIRAAYKTLYRAGLSFEEAKRAIRADCANEPALAVLADFLDTVTRGIAR
jgi:UDP-N-acetylglucosamine acyltransferase